MMAVMVAPSGPKPDRPRERELDRPTLERCRAADPIAFRAFVVRYERPVFALLSRILGRGPEVEDLAQETFLRAFRALPSFDPDGAATVSTWLLTIATRLALDVKRKAVTARKQVVTEVRTTEATPERDSARAELRRAIAKATAELPDDQRAAFVLAQFHGFSIAEIAKALNAPEATVKTRLFRAREKLAKALEPWENT
jgi:RNA polymerase sigma-70 factor (ECF subfamily)